MSAISLVLLSFLSQVTILTAQPPVLRYSRCVNRGGDHANASTYQSSYNTLVSEITSNAEIEYGFYNLSHGQTPDKVSIIGLCRGDIKPNECRICLKNASILVPESCPNRKEAMGGYDECFLRYSNRSIFGVMESNPFNCLWKRLDINVKEPEKYTQAAGELLRELREKAASGNSLRKFAAADRSASDFQTVFGAVQCTPDLSHQLCFDCLSLAISQVSSCSANKTGGRVIYPSCNVRYEKYLFYSSLLEESPPPPSPPPPPPPPVSTTSTGMHPLVGLINLIRVVLRISIFR